MIMTTSQSDEKFKPQVKSDHYYKITYDTKERFCSYWHQVHEVLLLNPSEVLEIGIGNGFVSRYLRDRRINVTTLDIDKELKPDVVGSVLDIPFPDASFQVVMCCEVLEHLPYDNVSRALSEISRVSKQYIVLSIPDANRVYRLFLHIPKIGIIKKLIPFPQIRKPIHRFDGEHYWEIGKAGYPLKRIISDIERQGMEIIKTYRVFESPYHRFFIMRKTER